MMTDWQERRGRLLRNFGVHTYSSPPNAPPVNGLLISAHHESFADATPANRFAEMIGNQFHGGDSMKHKLLLLLLVFVVLMGSAATARETPVITPVDPADIPVRTLNPNPAAGVVGNLNPGFWRVSGWFTGAEEYKYLFNPVEQLACPAGFQLTTVHMLLDFDDTMNYPITFPVWVDLEDALWDDVLQCWVPGIEDCRSDVFTVTIDVPGTYDIAIPINCECAYMTDPTGAPYWYMLSFHFPELFTANLITDDFPMPCYSWNNWGAGWVDLFTQGFPGGVVMWGDVDCCTDPVAIEERSWGDIKSLFR